MPFDTLQRTHKRIRATSFLDDDAEDICYYTPMDGGGASSCLYDSWPWMTTAAPTLESMLPPAYCPWDNNTSTDGASLSSTPPTPLELCSMEDSSQAAAQQEPGSLSPSPPSSAGGDPLFSKLNLSYTELGINMEARLSSATDLRLLIDTFSKLCTSDTKTTTAASTPSSPTSSDKKGIILPRNASSRTRPVNHFKPVTGPLVLELPQMISLRQVTDACVHTYFECWVRFIPVLHKAEFLDWYNRHPAPTDTLVVNALCAFVFRHMVIHHNTLHPDLQEDQEAFFLNRARDCLAQSFDCPDRHTVVALLFISQRAEPSRRHYYAAMATACLHELEIYPRMITSTPSPLSPDASSPDEEDHVDDDVDDDDDDDSKAYAEEMDTRLWWYAWGVDFSLYSSGTPKTTPQPRCPGQIDLPRVFEQDIDDSEWGIIGHRHCFRLWRIQADIVQTLYTNDDRELTVDELHAYDKQIVDLYDSLPGYLRLESGFEYGDEQLFVACLRVNVEFNATRLILHMLFTPDEDDPHPSPFALESLNICLATCLRQLRTLNTYFKVASGRCGFDRDELWRAAEVISTAMDIYRATGSAAIIKNIDMAEFNGALERALDILKQTKDYQVKRRDWCLLADWLQGEIQRHKRRQQRGRRRSSSAQQQRRRKSNTPDHFLANLKHQPPSSQQHAASIPSSTSSFSHFVSYPTPSPPPPSSSANSRAPVRIIPEDPFVHFTPAQPMPHSQPAPRSTATSTSLSSPIVFTTPATKGQTRFRYFNPRKMNKFLFIDENPALTR